MKIVLDTNCFISCIGKASPFRNVFDEFLAGNYTLCFTTEILLEYEEIFLLKWGYDVTENLMGRLLIAPNTQFATIYFNFNMVVADKDDNKFADLFIAANADFLVSNDSQILALHKSEFPSFQVITLQEFSAMLKAENKQKHS